MKGILRKALICAVSLAVIATCFGGTEVLAKKKAVHNVTYIYGLKSVTVQVPHGQNAPIPTDTAVDGFQFVTWIGSAANVTEDRVILGAYNKIKQPTAADLFCAPTGGYASGRKVNNNKTAPYPTWWGDINHPKGVPGKTCAVYWINGHNGELWKTEMVPYGTSLPTPEDPCISGYEFIGWEGDWTNITEDRVIKAWYFTNHKVTFVCHDCGKTIDVKYAHDGESVWAEPHSHEWREFDHYEMPNGGYFNKGDKVYSDMTVTEYLRPYN